MARASIGTRNVYARTKSSSAKGVATTGWNEERIRAHEETERLLKKDTASVVGEENKVTWG